VTGGSLMVGAAAGKRSDRHQRPDDCLSHQGMGVT
jgi:hypothetical protein